MLADNQTLIQTIREAAPSATDARLAYFEEALETLVGGLSPAHVRRIAPRFDGHVEPRLNDHGEYYVEVEGLVHVKPNASLDPTDQFTWEEAEVQAVCAVVDALQRFELNGFNYDEDLVESITLCDSCFLATTVNL